MIFEVDFDNEDYYSKLYMWINNGKDFIRDFAQVAGAFEFGTQRMTQVTKRVKFSNETINDLKMWSTINDECVISNAATIDYTLTVLFDINTPTSDGGFLQWRYNINGTPGNWNTVLDNTEVSTTLNNLSSGDVVYIESRINGGNAGTTATYLRTTIRIENTDPSALDYFNTASYFPTMECTEFLRGILVTFNAIMYWDAQTRKFIIKHREQWYNDGKTIDITSNIDTTKSTIKPPTFYKEYGFSFAEGKDFRNVQYKAVNNRIYGGVFNNTGLFTGDTYENKNPFTSSVWVEIVTESNNGNITFESDIATTQTIDEGFNRTDSGVRLMYYNGSKTAGGTYKVVDYTGGTGGNNTTYNYFLSALVSEGNLNLAYNTELDFKASGGVNLDTNLFTEFYQSYVESIYNPNVRRLSVSAYIPYNKLKTIEVNDTIKIGETEFLIDGFTVDLTTNKATFDLINKV